MRLIQPPPNIDSPLAVPPEKRRECRVPLTFVKYRFAHHAAPSGYDRICDYIDAPVVRLSMPIYWLGETLLRPFCLWCAKRGGKYEYSRYDCVMEMAVISEMLRSRRRIFHFIYSEKSFHLTEALISSLRKKGHHLIGTVHHMPDQQGSLFKSHKHFRLFDLVLTMDQASVSFWEGITGKSNVCHVPHGIDTDFFQPAQHLPKGKVKRIAFAGHHARDFQTLESVIAILEHKSEFKFDLIGNAQHLRDLKSKYQDRITLYSERVTDEAYRSILQSAAVFLSPLVSSTTCNAVLEAMACGTPVVTSKGGIEAYLRSDCARVAPAGDAFTMATYVEELAGDGHLPRAAARRNALLCSWSAVAEKHLTIIEKLYRREFGDKLVYKDRKDRYRKSFS